MRRFLLYCTVTLFVIHTAAHAQTEKQIRVGNRPDFLAVNSVTNQIYVGNSSDGTVSVVDGATNTVTATIQVGAQPQGVAVNSTTNTVYVALFSGLASTVAVIDGTTNTVVTDISVPGATYVAVNPVTNSVFVSNSDNTVRVIDGGSNTVGATIQFTNVLENIAVDAQRNLAYVEEVGSPPSIAVIDGTNNQVSTTFSFTQAQFLTGLDVDPTLNQLYAGDSLAGKLFIIGAASGSVLKALNTPNAKYVTLGNGSDVWVTAPNGNEIFRVNGSTKALLNSYHVNRSPWGMAVNSAGNLYIPLSQFDAIWAVVP